MTAKTGQPTIWSVVGARPQFVKTAAMSRAIARQARVQELLIHTGQHYDPGMSADFFRDLGIPEPAHNLGVGSQPPGAQVGRMLEAMEAILEQSTPRLIVVFGDTNSTLAAALIGAYHHIPVAHVEAGLRSYNWRMPEEVNRVLTDRLSALLFCPSDQAACNLAAEGVTRGVHVVGDIMYDVFLYYRSQGQQHADAFLSSTGIQGDFVLATIHRAENTDDRARLSAILTGLSRSTWPVVLPLHPRTRKMIGIHQISVPSSIHLCEPAGYLAMLGLEARARAIVTDSGGVQKEAYFAGIPCLTARDETEWVETVHTGWNRLVGASADAIAAGLNDVAEGRFPGSAERPLLYGDGAAADRMAALVAKAVGASESV